MHKNEDHDRGDEEKKEPSNKPSDGSHCGKKFAITFVYHQLIGLACLAALFSATFVIHFLGSLANPAGNGFELVFKPIEWFVLVLDGFLFVAFQLRMADHFLVELGFRSFLGFGRMNVFGEADSQPPQQAGDEAEVSEEYARRKMIDEFGGKDSNPVLIAPMNGVANHESSQNEFQRATDSEGNNEMPSPK